MHRVRFGFAALLALVTAGPARAQGLIQWDSGGPTAYPHAGSAPGTVVVKGTLKVDPGWAGPRHVTVQLWPGGGEVVERKVAVKGGVWGPAALSGLPQGVALNVVVDADLTNAAGKQETLRTEPKMVTTKRPRAKAPPPAARQGASSALRRGAPTPGSSPRDSPLFAVRGGTPGGVAKWRTRPEKPAQPHGRQEVTTTGRVRHLPFLAWPTCPRHGRGQTYRA